MTRRTTIADVAAAAGLSKTTVSMVLNDRPGTRLSPETAERVRAVAQELQYRPNLAARVLRQGRTRTVGFVSDDVTITRYASAMIRGLLDVADDQDHTVLIAETGHHPERVAKAVETMLDRRPDAVIFGFMAARQVPLPDLPDDLPVVLLNGRTDRPTPVVLPDELTAGRAMARVLLDAGHRDGIGLIGSFPAGHLVPEVSVTLQDRFAGIHEELASAGTEVVATADETSWGDPEHGYRATQRLLAGGARIRAIVAMNDNLAFGAYRALQEAGLSVPDDVSVVSFDDDVIASYVRPALTTARLPYAEMGQAAMRMALDGEVEPQTVLVPMPVQHRGSVGTP
jgi:LacI family transcriptional regulator